MSRSEERKIEDHEVLWTAPEYEAEKRAKREEAIYPVDLTPFGGGLTEEETTSMREDSFTQGVDAARHAEDETCKQGFRYIENGMVAAVIQRIEFDPPMNADADNDADISWWPRVSMVGFSLDHAWCSGVLASLYRNQQRVDARDAGSREADDAAFQHLSNKIRALVTIRADLQKRRKPIPFWKLPAVWLTFRVKCPTCNGAGRVGWRHPEWDKGVGYPPVEILCPHCGGLENVHLWRR